MISFQAIPLTALGAALPEWCKGWPTRYLSVIACIFSIDPGFARIGSF